MIRAWLMALNPWIVLAIVASLAGSHAYVYSLGKTREKDAAAQIQLKAERAYQVNFQKAVTRANELAGQLASRETEIVYRTKEVIKHVPQVTTGKPCLNPAAVRMLNARPDSPAVPQAPGKPVAEDAAALAASDSDVAYYIADASGQYETCAARLNALIDFENGNSQQEHVQIGD